MIAALPTAIRVAAVDVRPGHCQYGVKAVQAPCQHQPRITGSHRLTALGGVQYLVPDLQVAEAIGEIVGARTWFVGQREQGFAQVAVHRQRLDQGPHPGAQLFRRKAELGTLGHPHQQFEECITARFTAQGLPQLAA